MAAMIPNIAKGKFAYYAGLPAANDALVWVLYQATGLVSDATLLDYATAAAIEAGATNEASFTGYARVTATSTVVTVDNTNDRVDVDSADPSWSPTTAQGLGKIGLFYDPDTTGGTDADLVPLFLDDFVVTTPTSGTVAYTVASAGWGRAA
jgi:hypothetical protein